MPSLIPKHKFPIYGGQQALGPSPEQYLGISAKPTENTGLNVLNSKEHLVFIVTVTTLTMAALIALYIIKLTYDRRKKSYDTIDETTRTIISMPQARRKSSTKSFQGVFVYQNQPIDFILPGISTHLQTAPSSLNLSSDMVFDISRSNSHDSLPLSKHGSDDITSARSPSLLLGGLNPDLYRVGAADCSEDEDYPDNHRGRIWFKIHYEAKNEQLSVTLLKIKNLPSRVKGSVNCSDPFVRIYLLPDGRRYVQSKVKKKTCNPKFDETFVFQVPNKSIQDNSLRLTVLDNDRGKRHNIIGHVLVKLKEIDVTSAEPILFWRDLETEHDEPPSESGEINVSLCYNPTIERLTVTICEAKDLRWPEECPLDTYVKTSLYTGSKLVKVKKTTVSKKSFQPNYNESFHFKLNQSCLATSHILIQVNVSHAGHKGDKCLGRTVLGSHMFARGKALEHWTTATTTTLHKQIRQWHKLT